MSPDDASRLDAIRAGRLTPDMAFLLQLLDAAALTHDALARRVNQFTTAVAEQRTRFEVEQSAHRGTAAASEALAAELETALGKVAALEAELAETRRQLEVAERTAAWLRMRRR